jgi:NADH-quinone oxidoreductase subunit J
VVFEDVIFWVLAVGSVAAALGVVLLRDIFRAALLLVVVFLAVAGFFVMMNAEFLAVVQVLIYAGAIAVLIIFAIMLTREVQRGNLANRLTSPAAVLFPVLLLAALVFVAVDTDWKLLSDQPQELQERVEMVQANSIAGIPEEQRAEIGGPAERSGIGELLISNFVLPFEIASVLLLAAIIGALVLVRERQA